ncbi:sister chromatid cohesion protein PDS5 [Natronorubrum sp. DTA7]|uniref:sister chromatid cohesion protein PDS5 n=1 Tax=Natronorubrum sp. DTA7 TaxID=3447016 RepID=UPI003F82EF2A
MIDEEDSERNDHRPRIQDVREHLNAVDPTLRARWYNREESAATDPTTGRPLISDCIDALADTDRNIRLSCSRTLTALASTHPAEVGTSLADTSFPFTDNDDRVRANAVQAVSVVADQEPEVVTSLVSTLVKRLGDPNDDVRVYSAVALAALADHDALTIASITDSIVYRLKDDVIDVRLHVAEVLAAVAVDSPSALEGDLEPILEESRAANTCLRHAMTSALGDCIDVGDDPRVQTALFERLSDSYPAIREAAASALRQSARQEPSSMRTPEAIEALIEALADPSSEVRTNTAWALKHVGYDDYWRVALESDAEPATVAGGIAQTYRSVADLDLDAQLEGARRCSICRTQFSEPEFEHPNVVCEECMTELDSIQSDPSDRSETTDERAGSSPVSIDGAKCWRQVRFGELVTMRDAHDCDTYTEFLEGHFTRDGTPIQSVRF